MNIKEKRGEQGKRAVSEVLATILIVLFVIAALVIVSVVLFQFIRKQSQEITAGCVTTGISIRKADYNSTSGDIIVYVKRDLGDAEMAGMKFIFDGKEKMPSSESDNLTLKILETGIYIFRNITSKPRKIEAAPAIKTEADKEMNCGIKAAITERDIVEKTIVVSEGQAQQPSSGEPQPPIQPSTRGLGEFGDGNEGIVFLSSASTIVNNYSYITQDLSSETKVLVVDKTTEFKNGDEILIIQVNNENSLNSGQYEFNTIEGINQNNMILVNSLKNNYNASTTDKIAQVIRVPEYKNLTINSGASINAKAWDGSSGGVIALKVQDTFKIAGSINADGKGFSLSGGPGRAIGDCNGVGGAGYGGNGGNGSNSWTGSVAVKGSAYGSQNLSRIYLGSGARYTTCCSSNTGPGGGVIIIFSNKIDVNGVISSSAGNCSSDSCGSAGSGGSIYIKTNIFSGYGGSIFSKGGLGKSCGLGYWPYSTISSGGGGGGRIAIYYSTNNFLGNINAAGGAGYTNGESGTILTQASS